MDWNEAWSKITAGSKSAWSTSANRSSAALDSMSPALAPFAARWDAEADRRRQLRTPENLRALMDAQKNHTSARSTTATAKAQRSAARSATKNPLAGARRAARTAHKAAIGHHGEAKAALKSARRNYPATLTTQAAKAHAMHAAPAGIASWLMSTGADWTVWPATVSAGLIGLNVAGLWLGRRTVTVPIDDDVSADERMLLERLDPGYWIEHAAERGLDGTLTGTPALSESGITVAVRLDGKWTPAKLADAESNVRALLGCRTDLPIEITAGERGGWSVITLRTRLAVDGADMAWNPDRIGIGLDTVTGEPVEIPLENRLTVAGASGSGKSWSSRPHMARAHMAGDLVFVDGKGEEATIWTGVCRVAVEPDEIRDAVGEVHAEMNRRKADMKRRGLSVWDGQQLTLFVDEGRVILALKDKKLTQKLIDISALGRSRGVVLLWATQYPVTSGDAPGIHAQIAANTDSRFALRVKNLTHAQVALDDDADYGPHLIKASKDMRGHGYLGGHGPRLIRTWTMTDDMVKALPAKVWHGGGNAPAEPVEPAERPALRLVKDGPAAEIPAQDATGDLTDNQRAVLDTVHGGAASNAAIAKATGLNPGSVDRAVKALVKRGLLAKDGSDIREVSA